MEQWKDIPGYEGLYQASNLGRIKSLKWGRWKKSFKILKIQKSKYGYSQIRIGYKSFRVHKLIAITFIENIYNKYAINHINGIKTDNRVENLEWCTKSENELHSYRILKKGCHFKGKIGVKNHNSKTVNQYTKTGEFIKTWDSIADIERELGYNHGNISMCCNGKQKTSKGYMWKFIY